MLRNNICSSILLNYCYTLLSKLNFDWKLNLTDSFFINYAK
jgi:hypothetical protein